MLWQRHHVAPCVGLGFAAPSDKWCFGCVYFTTLSDNLAIEAEDKANRDAKTRANRHVSTPRRRR